MIVAGIDEAGYGPLLGPLVVGTAAIRVRCASDLADPLSEIPDLWTRWSTAVCRSKPGKTGRLHVADSKAVYSPSAGLRELERSLLAFVHQLHPGIDCLDTLLSACTLDPAPLRDRPWYAGYDNEPFPAVIAAPAVATSANALRVALHDAGDALSLLLATAMPEHIYNDFVTRTRNKSSVLFSAVAQLIARLMQSHPNEPILIVCDRQGGRSHYGQLLRTMFEDFPLTVEQESDALSSYRLARPAGECRLIFMEKSENVSLPTALASILCKYLREMLMSRFNAFFLRHDPAIVPTAGYWTDAQRFLADTATLRTQLNIPDETLARLR